MKNFAKTSLAIGLITLSAYSVYSFAQRHSNNISATDKAKIEEIVHQYLINKPEVLMEAIQVLQTRQNQQTQQTLKQTQQTASKYSNDLFKKKDDPMTGNPDGDITIVEFFDYQCPHCVDMAPVIEAIVKANPNVRVVFKEFPIRGPMSEKASLAAIAAHKQGKYYQFSRGLLSTQPPLTAEKLDEVAKNVGLDVEKFKTDMSSDAVKNELKQNITLGQNLKLLGTPAFFIWKTNGKTISYIPGQLSQEQLQTTINQVQ